MPKVACVADRRVMAIVSCILSSFLLFHSPSNNNISSTSPSNNISLAIKERRQKKNGIMWEKFPSGRPPSPLPPVWEFSHFLPFFLPFYKPLNWKKNREKYGVSWGQTPPPPLWEFSPHNPVFF